MAEQAGAELGSNTGGRAGSQIHRVQRIVTASERGWPSEFDLTMFVQQNSTGRPQWKVMDDSDGTLHFSPRLNRRLSLETDVIRKKPSTEKRSCGSLVLGYLWTHQDEIPTDWKNCQLILFTGLIIARVDTLGKQKGGEFHIGIFYAGQKDGWQTSRSLVGQFDMMARVALISA